MILCHRQASESHGGSRKNFVNFSIVTYDSDTSTPTSI